MLGQLGLADVNPNARDPLAACDRPTYGLHSLLLSLYYYSLFFLSVVICSRHSIDCRLGTLPGRVEEGSCTRI